MPTKRSASAPIQLNTEMDYRALILGMHNSSGNLTAETVTVTIPEGYTVRQTIRLLAEKGVNTEENLLEAAKTATYDYSFINNNSEDPSRLEGYLFPDTYEFYKNHNAKNALGKLIDAFADHIDEDAYRLLQGQIHGLQHEGCGHHRLPHRKGDGRYGSAAISPPSSITVCKSPARPQGCCRSTRPCSMACRITPAPSPTRTRRSTPPTTCIIHKGLPPTAHCQPRQRGSESGHGPQ